MGVSGLCVGSFFFLFFLEWGRVVDCRRCSAVELLAVFFFFRLFLFLFGGLLWLEVAAWCMLLASVTAVEKGLGRPMCSLLESWTLCLLLILAPSGSGLALTTSFGAGSYFIDLTFKSGIVPSATPWKIWSACRCSDPDSYSTSWSHRRHDAASRSDESRLTAEVSDLRLQSEAENRSRGC